MSAPSLLLALLALGSGGDSSAEKAPASAPRRSGAEAVSWAKGEVSRVETVRRDLQADLDEARERRDLPRRNCIEERLARLTRILRVSEDARVEIEQAAARGKEARVAHASTKLEVASGQALVLRSQAASCLGQFSHDANGRTDVRVEVQRTGSSVPGR